jgi:hypothetical protein
LFTGGNLSRASEDVSKRLLGMDLNEESAKVLRRETVHFQGS